MNLVGVVARGIAETLKVDLKQYILDVNATRHEFFVILLSS